jgi:hypothetical protein
MSAARWSQTDFAARLIDAGMPLPEDVTSWADASPRRRFGVYRNNMRGALGEALAVRYAAVKRLVGNQFFLAMAQSYALQNLPRSPVLIEYGASFPRFIAGFEPAGSLPYLADVARLESAYWQAYHAENAAPIEAAAFAALGSTRLHELCFDMLPSMAIVRSAFPIVAIWRTNVEDEEIAEVDMNTAEDALVARPHMDVEVRRLPAGANVFLSLLQQGMALGEAAGVAADASPEFDLASNLAGLVQAHIVRNIR